MPTTSTGDLLSIIEGLLRHADLEHVNFHHQRILVRAYDACEIEVERVTRYHRGSQEYIAVMPVKRKVANYCPGNTTDSMPDTASDPGERGSCT